MIARAVAFLRGTLVQRALTLGVGAAVGQAAVVGVTPLLARIYDKGDFGVLAVVLALTGVGVVISSLRYEQAIVVAETDEEASAAAKAAGGFSLLTVLVASLLALAVGDALARWTNSPALRDVLWMVPVIIAAGAGHQMLVAWATRRGDFRALSQAKAALGIGLAVSQLVLGFVFDGAVGLVAGVGIAWFVAIVFLVPAAGGLTWASDRAAWEAIRRYRRFPEFSLFASLFNRGALEIPAVALAALYGPEVAGAFLLANRMVATPARLVTESAYQVYLNEASRLLRDDPSGLVYLFRRTLRRMALLCAPAVLVLALAGPPLLVWVFGDEWSDSASYVRLLAVLFAAMLVTQPVESTLWLLERQDLQLLRDVARVVMVSGAFLAAWWLDASAIGAVAAYVGAMVAGYAFLLLLCRLLLQQQPEPAAASVEPAVA